MCFEIRKFDLEFIFDFEDFFYKFVDENLLICFHSLSIINPSFLGIKRKPRESMKRMGKEKKKKLVKVTGYVRENGMELIYGICAETALESQTARFSVDILVIEQSRHCRKTKYPLKISAIPPWILHVINDSTILPAILSSSTHRIFIINLRRISIPFTIFPQIRSIREGRQTTQ